jgi:hypothetical protein
MKTNDEINELTDLAFSIIREGLESTDQYTKMRTALDFVQMLTISAFSERLKAVERWAEEISKTEEKI